MSTTAGVNHRSRRHTAVTPNAVHAVEPRIAYLKEQGCDRILLVPLYPQFAAATTATACDQAFRALMRMRWQPTVRIAPPYGDEPAYIDAIAASVRAHLVALDFEPEALIASFHGMPQKYLERGDPYHCQFQKTSRLLREKPPEKASLREPENDDWLSSKPPRACPRPPWPRLRLACARCQPGVV